MVSGGHLTPLDLENFLEKLLLAAGEFFAGILIIMLNLLKVYSIQTVIGTEQLTNRTLWTNSLSTRPCWQNSLPKRRC